MYDYICVYSSVMAFQNFAYVYKYAVQIHSLWLYINFKLVFCLAYQDFLLLLTTITMMMTTTLLLSIEEKYNKIFHLQQSLSPLPPSTFNITQSTFSTMTVSGEDDKTCKHLYMSYT